MQEKKQKFNIGGLIASVAAGIATGSASAGVGGETSAATSSPHIVLNVALALVGFVFPAKEALPYKLTAALLGGFVTGYGTAKTAKQTDAYGYALHIALSVITGLITVFIQRRKDVGGGEATL